MRIGGTKMCHGAEKCMPIFSIDISATNIITSSLGGEITIWNMDYEAVKTIRKHTGAVLCVRFNALGSLFASGGDDGFVFVCDMNGKVVASMSEHESDVSNVMWTNKFLVSVGYDGYVVLYDLELFIVEEKFKPHEGQIKGIACDASFKYMCTQGEDGIVLYEDFKIVGRVEIKKGVILESFFSRMSWSPNGKLFASGLSFNGKYNTVDVFSTSLENECSFVGHAAPCEVVSFNPNVYWNEREYCVLAVSSQDLSVSFWCSLYPKPFLLIKNLTEQPILDMRWNKNGTSLLICSYSGEVKRIDVQFGEFGNPCEEHNFPAVQIFFSVENMKMFCETNEKHIGINDAEKKMRERRVEKKVVKPVLICSIADENKSGTTDGENQPLVINRENGTELVKAQRISSFLAVFGDYKVKLDENKNFVSVYRGPQELYKVCGNIKALCSNKRYMCVYTGKLQLYHLRTGVLVVPFIQSGDIVTMSILRKRLLYLLKNGSFAVFSFKRHAVCSRGDLPAQSGFSSIRLHRKYFIVAKFSDEEYFFHKSSGIWFLRTPKYNTISANDTDFEQDRDETFEFLENKFLIMHLVGNKSGLLRIAKKIVRAASRTKQLSDSFELRLNHMFQILLDTNERNAIVKMLEMMNQNYLLQPFVFSVLKKIGTM